MIVVHIPYTLSISFRFGRRQHHITSHTHCRCKLIFCYCYDAICYTKIFRYECKRFFRLFHIDRCKLLIVIECIRYCVCSLFRIPFAAVAECNFTFLERIVHGNFLSSPIPFCASAIFQKWSSFHLANDSMADNINNHNECSLTCVHFCEA